MSQKIIYKIGSNGDIDDSHEFSDIHAAQTAARQLWSSVNGMVAVYGFSEYSPCDATPIYARTEFWRAWKMDDLGRISDDGR